MSLGAIGMSGVSGRMNAAEADLISVVLENAERFPDFPIFRYLERGEELTETVTYQQLATEVLRIAGAIQAFTSREERVLLVLNPGRTFIEAFLSVLAAGRVAVPCYPAIHKDSHRLESVLQNSGATMVLCDDSCGPQMREALERIGSKVLLRTVSSLADYSVAWVNPRRRIDEVALLQYTSGSTAEPKGVIITHRNLVHNLAQIRKKMAASAEDVGLIWLPPYHDMGLIGGILQPLFTRIPTVIMAPMHFIQRPLRWLKAITKYRATITGGPNFAFKHCVERIRRDECEGLDLSSVRVMFSGAERIRAETLASFSARFRAYGFRPSSYYPCYGMAESTLMTSGVEAGAGITVHVHEQLGTPYVSCGTSIDGQRLRVIDRATGLDCVEGSIGEVCIAGPSVTQGYHHNPEANANLYAKFPNATGMRECLLRTGDLGYFHAGELYITGRAKEVIIVRGKTYYPQDLEELIEGVDPAIQPAGVACFAMEADAEERLVVFCEIRRRFYKDFNHAWLRDQIVSVLVRVHGLAPHYVGFVIERALPRTTSDKLRRLHLRDLHREGAIKEIGIASSEAVR